MRRVKQKGCDAGVTLGWGKEYRNVTCLPQQAPFHGVNSSSWRSFRPRQIAYKKDGIPAEEYCAFVQSICGLEKPDRQFYNSLTTPELKGIIMPSPQKLLIIGCGDIGQRTAKLALQQDWQVTGLARSAETLQKLRDLEIKPIEANLLDPASLDGIETRGSSILYLAPPPGGGNTDPKVRQFCAAIEPGNEPDKIVYMSTSGIYGDRQGDRVTEATPPNPQTSRARRRFDAETSLRQYSELRNVSLVILRVTGIYGPHRFPLHRLLEQHPVLREADASYTNRIHADDLARICLKAVETAADGEIFNVSDGQESTMTEYFNLLADTFDLPRPPQISLTEAQHRMTPLMLSYFRESRRMDNSKLLKWLGTRLRYPTLREGLKASLEQMLEEDPDFFRNVLGRS